MSMNNFYNSQLLSSFRAILIENAVNDNILKEAEMADIESVYLSDKDIKLDSIIQAMNETLNELLAETFEPDVLESLKEAVTEASILQEAVVAQKVRKLKDKMSNKVVKFTLAEKEMSKRINDKFNRFLQIARDNRRTTSYDRMVKNAIDLSRTIKNLIGSIVVGLLIPGGIQVKLVTAAIALIAKVAYDKRTHNKYKGMILNDLRFELKVVQEKIKDAEVRGDIKAKYKLMRIENQIARTIDRIKYNLREYQY